MESSVIFTKRSVLFVSNTEKKFSETNSVDLGWGRMLSVGASLRRTAGQSCHWCLFHSPCSVSSHFLSSCGSRGVTSAQQVPLWPGPGVSPPAGLGVRCLVRCGADGAGRMGRSEVGLTVSWSEVHLPLRWVGCVARQG